MFHIFRCSVVVMLAWCLAGCHKSAVPSSVKINPQEDVTDYAVRAYKSEAIKTLEKLVSFPTVYEEGRQNRDLPAVKNMTAYLKEEAQRLGLGFQDYQDAVVISLGKSKDRLGLFTHGDVQPANAQVWKKNPFTLDRETEPGKMIGRGSQDDKGAIALAMYAMKAIADYKAPLGKKVELVVSYTEESNWAPFEEFLKKVPPPPVNIGFDASYPVTVAQKGSNTIKIRFASVNSRLRQPYIDQFVGGYFTTQVPGVAEAVIEQANVGLMNSLKQAAQTLKDVAFTFELNKRTLVIRCTGESAHSASPDKGKNAVTHLAELLSTRSWPITRAANVVKFIHDMVGLGVYGQKWGQVAYRDEFMGPLTLNASYVKPDRGDLELVVNIRRPTGKTSAEFETQINEAFEAWKQKNAGREISSFQMKLGDPHYQKDAPQVASLLAVFEKITGIKDAKPISIGGGTHARLLPGGVDFGPSMPGEKYTGHTEHEFITEAQFELNLKMYTAMILELAK